MDNKYDLRRGVSTGLAALALALSVGCASTKISDPRFQTGYDRYISNNKGELVPMQVKFDGYDFVRTECTEKDNKGNYVPSKGFYKTNAEAKAASKNKQGVLFDLSGDIIGIGISEAIKGL